MFVQKLVPSVRKLRQDCISILSFFRSSITVAVVVVFCCALTGGLAAYQNDWDRLLHVTCNRYQGEALYSVQSTHSNRKEDRRWMWQCKQIVPRAMSSCYWTGYRTNYDQPFLFHCPTNYVLSGVNSVHSNKKEDRRWNFYCCRAAGYCTKRCYWTNYINNWDAYMNYRAPHPWVFTGAYSYHSNKKE